jgi:hypothetical protein
MRPTPQRDERSALIGRTALIASTGERRLDACPLPFWSNTAVSQRATGPTEG